MSDCEYILELRGITKSFPGVQALDNVSLRIRRGEIHALLGANGAGKSTLIKIIAGQYSADAGEVLMDGNHVYIKTPIDAQKLGISVVFQELTVFPDLNVLENIFINREITRCGFYGWKAMREKTQEIIDNLDLGFSLTDRVGDLPIAQQQIVEIVKAVSFKTKLLILDEPTSSLSAKETDRLFEIIHRLHENGTTILYISHRLDEIYANCERLTLLRDGRWILTRGLNGFSREDLIYNMIGRSIEAEFPPKTNAKGEELLRVERFDRLGVFRDITFTLHSGEVLGFAGLVGAGRTELMRAIYGVYPRNSGEMYLKGRKLSVRSPQDALENGIIYATESRKDDGLLMGRSILENVSVSSLDRFSHVLLDHRTERNEVERVAQKLNVVCRGLSQRVMDLSGGNQQKVCLAKWLLTDPQIFILDEPTRGIDVGAKAEFYRIINELAENGAGVIVVSSEEQELIGICDRILVMHEGRITGEVKDVPQQPDVERRLMSYIMNASESDKAS
jgi:ABC-type sugar transport system ATPase subunit